MTSRRYAMVNRPAGFGTVPNSLRYEVSPRPAKGEPHFEMARHGILVVTDRELTVDEMLAYEIAEIVEDEELTVHAGRVVSCLMSEHPREYLESAEDDAEMFARGVLQSASRSDAGVFYSFGDGKKLVDEVVAELKRLCCDPQEG